MTIPNIITIGRLMAVPVMIWLIANEYMRAAFYLFLAAGISDGIDGFIAKRFNQRSELGAMLDPLADKMLLMAVYISLGLTHDLPGWLVILVVARDAMILGGFLLLGTIGPAPRADPLYISKVNTTVQILLAALILGVRGFGWSYTEAVLVLEYAAAATTFLSGLAYLVRWMRQV